MASRLVRKRKTERRLATVLAADVAGYSRLMGGDEEGTLRRLNEHRRDLVDPCIARHAGRIVKTTGDGLLAEFASPVEAVRCAVAIQQGLQGRNARIGAERRIELRIGINLGDIIFERGDIFGEGVNIAARLEALAPAGGIVISRTVRDQVRDRLECRIEDLGEQTVKNIARPVRCYRVVIPDPPPAEAGVLPVRRRSVMAAAIVLPLLSLGGVAGWWWQSTSATNSAPVGDAAMPTTPPLSFVVLPFRTEPREQAYVGEAAAVTIAAALSRLPGSFVVDPGTALGFGDGGEKAADIGRSLGARYALQGNIAEAAGTVTIQAKLIATASGEIAWSDRLEGTRAALIQGIPERLARTLSIEPPKEIVRRSATDLSAIDLTMRGATVLRHADRPSEAAKARELFQQALGIDDTIVEAWVGLARGYLWPVWEGATPPDPTAIERADSAIGWALALAADDGNALALRAGLQNLRGASDNAVRDAEAAIAANRNDAEAHAALGLAQFRLDQPKRALVAFAQALWLSPRDPAAGRWRRSQAWVLLTLDRDAEALAMLQKAEAIDPKSAEALAMLAGAYALAKQDGKAGTAAADAKRLRPDSALVDLLAVPPFASGSEIAAHDRLTAALRRAGLVSPSPVPHSPG